VNLAGFGYVKKQSIITKTANAKEKDLFPSLGIGLFQCKLPLSTGNLSFSVNFSEHCSEI
jgi:hypothetical protein